MQISVESTSNLGRKVAVEVPAERISDLLNKRLTDLSKNLRMDGYRPGKVPISAVRRRFGESVQDEVVSEVMRSSFMEAIEKEDLKPAGPPEFEPKNYEQNQPLEYTATFEELPKITISPLSEDVVEKDVAEVSDDDLDKMIEKVRQQQATWEMKEGAAEEGDKLTMDFVGSVDGEEFDGGRATAFELELGSKRMIPGFEEGLFGVTVGVSKVLKVTFPEEYHAADLAGKEAEFAVDVTKVEHPVLPELNDEFAKKMRAKDENVAGFKTEIRNSMERELERLIDNRLKENVFKKLAEKHPIDVPAALVDQEILQLIKSSHKANLPKDEKILQTLIANAREQLGEKAQYRVSLGLLVNEIIQAEKFEPNADEINKVVTDMAQSYDDPDAFVQWYLSEGQRREEAKAVALEKRVMDHLLQQMTVEEKQTTYAELFNA